MSTSGKSTYLSAALLNHVMRNVAFSQPAYVHVGLFTAALNEAGGGTEVSSSNTNYARANVACNSANWVAPAGDPEQITNNAAVNFNTPTNSWGTVSHFGIFDAAQNGNLLYWGALSSNQGIGTGNAISFPANTLNISES